MANPFPFTAGQVLTAAQLNGIGEEWTSYTPVITQGATITKTVTNAIYTRVNRIVFFQIQLALTSAGTANTPILIDAPVAASSRATQGVFNGSVGAGGFYDASTTNHYNATVQINGSNKFALFANGAGGSLFGQFPAITIANGDFIFLQGSYETFS